MPHLLLLLALCAALLPSCEDTEAVKPATPSPFQEVLDQGAGRYLGKARVQATLTEEGVTTYTFDPASGPVCLKGGPYSVGVRDTGSEGLFFFLQGGGACYREFCLAINQAAEGIPQSLDVLDPTRKTNPLAGWSTVYLPYCDGSMFAGDAEHDDDGDGKIDRQQRGLANLSAALDVAAARFPSPRRVVLAGSSGGGYGTILAALLVRARYPGVELMVLNDAGVGLGKPEDPGFIARVLDELNITPLLPRSCVDCTKNGHVTRLIDWQLARDPQLRMGVFSSYEDFVISEVFLQIPKESFKAALLSETGALHGRYPDRYRRFLIAGDVHTTLLGKIDGLVGSNLGAVTLPKGSIDKLGNVKLGGIDTTQLRGVTFASWLAGMLEGSAAWDDRIE